MARRTRSGRLAAIIIGLAVVLAFFSSLGDSPVVDEVPHIGAGYSYIQKADMRLNPEHPPLVKDLAGLAIAPLDFSKDVFATTFWNFNVNGQWSFGRKLIYDSDVDPDTVKNLARLPMLAFLVLAGWLVWKWTRERYGDTAAVIATLLLVFSPTVMAHARLVTTDVAAAVAVTAATYMFLRLLNKPSEKAFALTALVLGLAFLSKFNVILLGPFFAITALLHGLDGHWRSRKYWLTALRTVGLTALLGIAAIVFVVWPVYIAHTWNYPIAKQVTDTRAITASHGNNPLKAIALWSADKPVIRALGHWTLGLAMVAQRNAGGNTIYWLGRIVDHGGPWYFPLVYFMKEPLAWWILFSMALTALVFHRRRWPRRTTSRVLDSHGESGWSRNQTEWVWLLWLAIYWAVSMRSTLNIGVRHLLPIYPFTIMLVSGRLSVLIDWLRVHDRKRLKWFSLAITGLLGWYVFESVGVFPYYLTYFNQLAGGPSGGHQYVADSNLDWGQDLKRLGQWVETNNIKKLSLDYFGWADPSWYLGKRYVWTSVSQWKDTSDFTRNNQSDGWLAISATFFQQATHQAQSNNGGYRWLLGREPDAVIGNSIFVWHITQ